MAKFVPPVLPPKIGEWWLMSVVAYNEGDERVDDEEYYAEVISEKVEDDVLMWNVQDLGEEAELEQDCIFSRFIMKLDPLTIDDSYLSDRSFIVLTMLKGVETSERRSVEISERVETSERRSVENK